MSLGGQVSHVSSPMARRLVDAKVSAPYAERMNCSEGPCCNMPVQTSM